MELSNALLRANWLVIKADATPPDHARGLLRDAAHAIMQMWDDVNQPVIAPV